MEYLRRTVAQIAQQLDVLTRSQRLAIGLAAVVVAGSLLVLVQFAAAPERIPVLKQDFSLDDLDAAMSALQTAGIEATQVGNRIYVAPRDRDRALLEINRVGALPADTSIGFAELMQDSDPFRPSDENRWRREVALGNELARIIASGDDVESARVITQARSKRRIGAGRSVQPSASVFVRLHRGGQVSQPMVNGLCRFVSSAVPGLQPHHVTIVDSATMRSYTIPDPRDALGVGLLEERKKNEKHLTDKLLEALQSIPGVLVSVSVQLDASRTQTETQDWDDPQVKMEKTLTEVNETNRTPGETGVNPNVGVALNGRSEGQRQETEDATTEFFQQNQLKFEKTERAPFSVTRATASVGIPRSFLVGVYQARFGAATDPAKLDDERDFQELRDAQLAAVRTAARTILMSDREEDVTVEVFYDFAADSPNLNTFPAGTPVLAAQDMDLTGYARTYGTQTLLALLALTSFFVMSRMVKRSADIAKKALPDETDMFDPDGELSVAGGPVGKAVSPEGMLVGHEIDDDTLRFTQLGDQVSKMIDDDPQMAAELIRRWAQSN